MSILKILVQKKMHALGLQAWTWSTFRILFFFFCGNSVSCLFIYLDPCDWNLQRKSKLKTWLWLPNEILSSDRVCFEHKLLQWKSNSQRALLSSFLVWKNSITCGPETRTLPLWNGWQTVCRWLPVSFICRHRNTFHQLCSSFSAVRSCFLCVGGGKFVLLHAGEWRRRERRAGCGSSGNDYFTFKLVFTDSAQSIHSQMQCRFEMHEKAQASAQIEFGAKR